MAHTSSLRLVPTTGSMPYGASFERAPMNPADYGKTGTIASWLSPTGCQRTLPTNIRDMPSRVNVNSLRMQRVPRFTDPLPEGASAFNTGVCTDNFVEERADATYLSGSIPSILRSQRAYQTEYSERVNEALPQYRAALLEAGLAAKVPAAAASGGGKSRRAGEAPVDYVQYARGGFARGATSSSADATLPSKQGAAWVGTAPVHMHASVQATALAGLKPEFQKIHPSADGKMKCVITCAKDGKPPPSANLDTTMARFAAGELCHAAHWQSMYQTMICKAPRR